METPKPKEPSSYPLADQIPRYTAYGWRRLQIGEKIKSTDYYTATSNSVDFLDQDPEKPIGVPRRGFLSASDVSGEKLDAIAANYIVILRPWFPNRNPLLKLKS